MAARAELADIAVGEGYPVRLMAVINVSPESFYPGSVAPDAAALRDAAQRAVVEGADLIDVGAMSTAPYRDTEISPAEELRRMTGALVVVAASARVPISADTTRAEVARAALDAGAAIINYVTGFGGDEAMGEVLARARGVILVASRRGHGEHVSVEDVRLLLDESLQRVRAAGVTPSRVVLDPGIGFFTGLDPPPEVFNCRLLADLESLASLGRPLLVGVSRKSFIGKLTGRIEPAERLSGSLAATALAVHNGAAVIRTHDVGATRDAVRIAEAVRAERAAVRR
jgi:dihydropteroate synthase